LIVRPSTCTCGMPAPTYCWWQVAQLIQRGGLRSGSGRCATSLPHHRSRQLARQAPDRDRLHHAPLRPLVADLVALVAWGARVSKRRRSAPAGEEVVHLSRAGAGANAMPPRLRSWWGTRQSSVPIPAGSQKQDATASAHAVARFARTGKRTAASYYRDLPRCPQLVAERPQRPDGCSRPRAAGRGQRRHAYNTAAGCQGRTFGPRPAARP
jgi:hypothetical protein